MIPQNYNRSTNVAMEHNNLTDEAFIMIAEEQGNECST